MNQETKRPNPKYVMMSAFALCPDELSHPERMNWIAEYFMREMNFKG